MKKFKVLIVDEDLDFLKIIIKWLKAIQIEAIGAESRNKGLELLESQDFDIILLDIKMPEMDGIETLREIKKRTPLAEVILLAGHASVESGIQYIQPGAFNYLMKPMGLNELLEKMWQGYDRKVIQAEMERCVRVAVGTMNY